MSLSYPCILKPLLLTPAQLKAAEQRKASVAHSWLISPLIDLLFVCGFAPWILGLTAFFLLDPGLDKTLNNPGQHAFNLFFIVASLLIGEAHQFTSIIRYLAKHPKKPSLGVPRLRTWFIIVAVMHLIGLGTWGAFSSSSMTWSTFLSGSANFIAVLAVFLFPVFLMQHVIGQAKSIGLMYCGKEGFKLSKFENFILSAMTFLLFVSGSSSIAVPFGLTSSMDSPFVASIASGLWWNALAISVLFALLMLRRGFKSNEWLPCGAGILWANLAAFTLFASLPAMIYVFMFVPIFFHSTQHWAVAWTTMQKESGKAGENRSFKDYLIDSCKLVLPVQAVSLLVLFLPMFFSSQGNSVEVGIERTLPLSWSLFVFYFHYFADRVVWRNPNKGDIYGRTVN